MAEQDVIAPDNTAERVALWRAMHVLVDPPPHVIEDSIGLEVVAPPDGWRDRPDMDPLATRGFRAAIVARARFIDDLVTEQADRGVRQYVALGAGVDTFAQRKPEIASRLQLFEIDRSGAQAWKRQRLIELGYGIPDWLHLVPVDFEIPNAWWAALLAAGFDATQPAVVASTGVTMYLTRDATLSTLRQLSSLAPGSTVAMTFLLPADQIAAPDRQGLKTSAQGARASGTPFISFYSPADMLAMAQTAGFPHADHLSGQTLADRYFANRADGLRPSTGEDFLIATT